MKQLTGISHNINDLVLGKFSYNNNIFLRDRIVFCNRKPFVTTGIKAFIVPEGKRFKTSIPILEVETNLPFEERDIVSITTDGTATVVWEANSPHNALYVTDVCNSKCIMCPQIEGKCSRYDECLKIIDLIDFKRCDSIGVTGGEPTLNIDKLVEVLEKVAKKAPKTSVHILTNGRNFAKQEYAEKVANVKGIKLSFGIPLFSDVAEEHDFIVGVKGAFSETIQGIYNLGKLRQDIEIRTVILKQNYKNLKNLAEYIYRNVPFINHVALMSMEYHGNAEINYDLVAVDPIEYKQELFEAVREFVRYGMNVDVYNTPLCLVDKRIDKYCRDSISTWKKTFLSQCANCNVKDVCSGVFETSFKHSSNIKPII